MFLPTNSSLTRLTTLSINDLRGAPSFILNPARLGAPPTRSNPREALPTRVTNWFHKAPNLLPWEPEALPTIICPIVQHTMLLMGAPPTRGTLLALPTRDLAPPTTLQREAPSTKGWFCSHLLWYGTESKAQQPCSSNFI